MTRKIFILVPADTPDGPVKGAYALANALAVERDVTLVLLKPGPGARAALDPRVRRLSLAETAGFGNKLRRYRGWLASAGGRDAVASISMCLSADAINALCRRDAVTCCSVRGNLLSNYRLEYGPLGVPLAAAHLIATRRFDHVVTMTNAMARQVRPFAGREPDVIANFVDEAARRILPQDAGASGPLRFAFVGSLTERKQPWLLVQALAALRDGGEDVVADVLGTGPMRSRVEAEVERLGLAGIVTLSGFVGEPAGLLERADAMVLPSLSEGVPRAALEALHLGVPCVLRDVDGNSALIRDGMNGALFADDGALPAAMLRAAQIARRRHGDRTSLLPAAYRQHSAAAQYLNLVERSDR